MDLNKKLVLLGNSGWETSNHLSVLQKLSKVNSGNVQIVVPLSYGNPVYINHVIAEGYRLLGKCFVPITDFFPPQTYGYLLQKTDAGIFNSWRTQGVGNIVALLYLGKQLYISHRATYLGFLRRKGFAVKSVNDYYKNGLTLLSEYDAQQNRRLIVDMYSNQACQNIVGDILTLY